MTGIGGGNVDGALLCVREDSIGFGGVIVDLFPPVCGLPSWLKLILKSSTRPFGGVRTFGVVLLLRVLGCSGGGMSVSKRDGSSVCLAACDFGVIAISIISGLDFLLD